MHMFWHSRTDSPLSVSCTYVIASGFTLAKKSETVVSWQLLRVKLISYWRVINRITLSRYIYITIFFAFTLGRKLSIGTSLSHIWMNCVSFLFASLLRSLIDCYHIKKNSNNPHMRIPLISQTYIQNKLCITEFLFWSKLKNVDQKKKRLKLSSIRRNVLDIMQLGPSNGGI